MHTKLVLLFIGFALVPFAWPLASPQVKIIPGSSVRGAELFREKACIECHSFNGTGGSIAPDLSQRHAEASTPMLLASALWNHGPRMWQAQQARRIRPALDSMETADLFAYFYSLSYFTAPGEAAKGAQLFEEKGCANCHETVPAAFNRARRSPGPPISTWTEVDDPLAWAERMWNHSEKVSVELSGIRPGWPQFSTEEMIDLLTYLRSIPEAHSQAAIFQPGDPEKGRMTFENRCESCHSFGSRTTERKIDLLKRPGPDVLTGYVAAMWNHAPDMHRRAGTNFPIFGPGDMSNLVAYLFAQRYFDEEGDIERGALVFQTKNCILCHEQRRKQTGAPDLTLAPERYSPITISASVWRHGPEMLEMMDQQKLSWPEFTGPEMSDLISFLNSRLVSRIARPN
jgi:cytochrome c2